MKYKIGQELYDFSADRDGTITPWLYVVRTIRGGWVYAILKEAYTWGKLSTKSGHYGWLDPLPPWTRYKARQGHKIYGCYNTKRLALVALKKDVNADEYGDYSPAGKRRILINIKRQLTAIKKGTVCHRQHTNRKVSGPGRN